MVNCFEDFCRELIAAGFSMSGSPKGIFSVIPYGWTEQELFDAPVKWHTGDPETDPWQWRMRVLEERKDIAYGKLFFGGAGYISREWYPYFLAARRQGRSFDEAYADGLITSAEKRVCETVREFGRIPLNEMKTLGGFGKGESSAFDRAVAGLQAKMYITVCGRTRRRNKLGEEYGWDITVFCTPEEYFGEELIAEAARISPDEAFGRISERILQLNPDADGKRIRKFILG